LQRRFLIFDTLFHSGDIRDRSAKSSEFAPKSMFFQPQIFLEEDPQILDLVFKIAPISDHVAKFCGNRPRDRGDLVLNEKEINSSKKHKGRSRVALSQQAALTVNLNTVSLDLRPADPFIRIDPKINQVVPWSLHTSPENFMQIDPAVFS